MYQKQTIHYPWYSPGASSPINRGYTESAQPTWVMAHQENQRHLLAGCEVFREG